MNKNITVEEILKATNGTLIYGNKLEECESFSKNTKEIKDGDVYIGFKGERFDGGKFYEDALKNGAKGAIINKIDGLEIKRLENKFVIQVDDTVEAVGQIAKLKREKYNIPVIAITGSVGKTSTKDIIYSVVSQKYNALKTQGNMNNHIGMPMTILGLREHEALVVEMGMNHFGEIHRLVTATKPTLAMITNIGVSHIENLGSREGILKSKLEILDGLEAGSPFIINVDNDMLKTILDKDEIMEKYDVITFGIESEGANYKAKNIKEENGSTSFDVEYTITKIIPEISGVTGKFYLCSQHIVIPTIGIHNVYNALAAFAVGITLGIDSQKSADALSNYVPAGMRQKSVTVGGITSIEDCYNASPDSMNAAIKTLANTKANKKIAVLGDMLELGDYSKKAHYEVGQAVADNKIDFLLAFGNDAKYIVDGAKENGMKSAFYFNNKEELSNKLFELANKGDAVIFKASRGMKLEDVINNVYDRWEK